ncbi:mechanosensitive ion channel domain-containing protein [Marinomonas sp. 2405UD68-3]
MNHCCACFSCAFFKASTRPFREGDWIRIGEFEGEVTD